jgi:excisionase family DNA binding protein
MENRMAQVTDETALLTIVEAASRMGVSDATILRWIAAGDLAAVRCGTQTTVRITDLERIRTTRKATAEPPTVERKLTAEEQRRWRDSLDSARRFREAWLERRQGEYFPPSWELLDESRNERSAERS